MLVLGFRRRLIHTFIDLWRRSRISSLPPGLVRYIMFTDRNDDLLCVGFEVILQGLYVS